MNQATLHRLIAAKELECLPAKNMESLYLKRLHTNHSIIQNLYTHLYGDNSFNENYPKLQKLLKDLFKSRPISLKQLDVERIKNTDWYQSEKIVGMQLYVDNFCNNLKELKEKLPYFENLGVNLLHLMPLNTRPEKSNDGGYAVNSYTEISKKYGSKKDLLELTKSMRTNHMYLMLDFVVNHTSNEFSWAKKAKSGDKKYQSYYYIFPDRTIPDAYELNLPEIFPESASGNFTYCKEMNKWVMTVFHEYQWDLNYKNPEVFFEMLSNLLSLANLGVDIIRLDALAFLWKKIGTNSQNLPETHSLISLFRMCLQVIAPGVVLLAEAIVSPEEIVRYFGEDNKKGNECEIAYNATLMALLWNSIATKKASLLYKNLNNIPTKPKEGTWINYVRCHDDIGFGFEDKYIYENGWDAILHRKFLLEYYAGVLDWSPSCGEIFMFNPKNGDGRITGSTASLMGLEKGLKTNNDILIEEAIEKIILVHSIILSFGGIPMVYAGDEIGTLNNYDYLKDSQKKDDSRWLNRPKQNWEVVRSISQNNSPERNVFTALQHLIQIRKKTAVFADRNNLRMHFSSNPHLFIYERTSRSENSVLIICNFDGSPQVVQISEIEKLGYSYKSGILDMVKDKQLILRSALLELGPYNFLWLTQL